MVALETTKLFSGLSPAEWETLRQAVQLKEFPAGAAVFQEGDPGDGVYVVRDGLIQITAMVNASERRPLGRIGPGDFFGEMAVLDNEPRSATAITSEPTICYFVPRVELLRMLETSPRMAVSLVREFSLRMRDFNRQYIREVLQAERLTLVGKFARSIVHDFKNPLNIIGLASDLASLDRATPQMRQNACVRIRKQVNRLTTMINELLEFTRGSQHAVVLSDLHYGQYVHQILEEIRAEAKEKSVQIDYENAPPDVTIMVDANRLTHVFFNLIHNAIDAMPGGGRIVVRFDVRDQEVVTELEDSGKGLAPEIINRLFEAFATYGKAQGTGLGLSICKKIVEDHRGWIKASSPPGRGAIFTFGLPAKH